MNPYSIPPLICALAALTLGIFAFKKKPRSPVNRTFALLNLEIFHWQICWFISFFLTTDPQKDFIVRFGYSLILYLPFTHYHFTSRLLNLSREMIRVWCAYVIASIWLILNWTTNYFIAGYHQFGWGMYGRAGGLHPVYLIFVALVFTRSVYLLKKSTKDTTRLPTERNQIWFVFLATLLYYSAAVEYLINYGIGFYPIGGFFILGAFSVIAYAIVRYRLMDIHFIIWKGMAKIMLILILFSVLVPISVIKTGILIKIASLVFVSSLAVFYLPKLLPKTEATITQMLYREKYKYQDKLGNSIERMPFIPQIEDLFKDTVNALVRALGVNTVAIFTLDPGSNSYNLKAQIGLDETKDLKISADNELAEWIKTNREVFVKEEMEKILHKKKMIPIEKTLIQLKSSICVPVMLETELIGIITLGEKSSGEIYSHIDLRILHRLGTMLAHSLKHKQTVAELQRERQMAEINKNKLNVITSMASGFADRLGNNLVSIKTYFDLFPEKMKEIAGEKESEARESLESLSNASSFSIDKMLRLTDIMRDFCKPSSYNFQRQEARVIIDIVDELTERLKPDVEGKTIKIDKALEGKPPTVYFDKNTIKEVLYHLIRNSIHAIPETINGKILVKVTGPVKRNETEFLRITVEDNGTGIAEKHRDDIFNPFFTTKGTAGGLGLGLVTCQFIVAQHEGEIRLAQNEVGRGTTFHVDLPVKNEPPETLPDYSDLLKEFRKK